MGMYDSIRVSEKEGQVKLWDCTGKVYSEGSTVPPATVTYGSDTYSIAMREGGYVNVQNRVLISWSERPIFNIIMDKWGDEKEETEMEGLGEGYFLD